MKKIITKKLEKILPAFLFKFLKETYGLLRKIYLFFFYKTLKDYFFSIYSTIIPVKQKQKVSIIIPSYKSTQFLKDAIESAINQTYKNTEILIMTDMPQERAREKIKKYLDKVTFFEEPNLHSIHKFNELIKRAKGELVVFLPEDDKLHPNFLKKTVCALNLFNSDIVYTDMNQFGEKHAYSRSPKWSGKTFVNGTPAGAISLLKKSAWRSIGGYKEIPFFDWDFYWTAYKMGFKGTHIKEVLIYCRIHPGQETNIVDHKKSAEILLRKHLPQSQK